MSIKITIASLSCTRMSDKFKLCYNLLGRVRSKLKPKIKRELTLELQDRGKIAIKL